MYQKIKKLAVVMLMFTFACLILINENVAANESLVDIKGHWAEDNIRKAVEQGYVNGYPNGDFGPNDTLTRAEFFKMVTLALNIEVNSTETPWYKPYVDAAIANSLYEVGDFSSTDYNAPLTREEMSKVAVRGLKLAEDIDEKEWMYIAAGKGIIKGTAIGEIAPEGTSTRAQAVVVIQRIIDVKNGVALPLDKYAVSEAELYWHRTNIITMLPAMFKDYGVYEGEDGIGEYDPTKNVFVSKSGTARCEVKELIVVDLDDPKDPNRKYLERQEYVVYGGYNNQINIFDIPNAYAMFSLSETVFDKPQNIGSNTYKPCYIEFRNYKWEEEESTLLDPNKINRHHHFAKLTIQRGIHNKSSSISFSDIKSYPSEPIVSISGYVFPKEITVIPTWYLYLSFYPIYGYSEPGRTVYQSEYNEAYEQ